MIFITFFGNCLAISLLAASLGTKYWITAQCKRLENAEKSDGNVNMGLFEYEANLNYGAGERNYQDKMLGMRLTSIRLDLKYQHDQNRHLINRISRSCLKYRASL